MDNIIIFVTNNVIITNMDYMCTINYKLMFIINSK